MKRLIGQVLGELFSKVGGDFRLHNHLYKLVSVDRVFIAFVDLNIAPLQV